MHSNLTKKNKSMKISELIKQLENLQKIADKDLNIRFLVKDFYTSGHYGHEMNFDLKTENWLGYTIAGDQVTLTGFNLKESEGKQPKVTFRK